MNLYFVIDPHLSKTVIPSFCAFFPQLSDFACTSLQGRISTWLTWLLTSAWSLTHHALMYRYSTQQNSWKLLVHGILVNQPYIQVTLLRPYIYLQRGRICDWVLWKLSHLQACVFLAPLPSVTYYKHCIFKINGLFSLPMISLVYMSLKSYLLCIIYSDSNCR